jgi:pyruvate kinase
LRVITEYEADMEINRELVQSLIQELDQILVFSENIEKNFSSEIHSTDPSLKKSARNLLHYLALRKHDLRHIQEQLAQLGLSSLGRSEGYVKSAILSVRHALKKLINEPVEDEYSDSLNLNQSKQLLERNTEALLGKQRNERTVRIMVTLSNEAADDYELILNLMKKGMDCARINCAHDNQEIWIRMVDHINRAQKETGLSCKILMDLAGLKLRTGPLTPGPKVTRIKTKRDFYGKLIAPAKIKFIPTSTPFKPDKNFTNIPVNQEWLQQLQPGDKIFFQDKRGKRRQFEVTTCDKNSCQAELFKRSYLETGTILSIKDKKRNIPSIEVGSLLPVENPIVLKVGDILILHKAAAEGEPARYDDHGLIIAPAHISCTLPEIFMDVNPGEPIMFDDGKIEGVIQSVSPEMLVVKIIHAKETGTKLGADKGINLPESKINFSGLTEKDKDDLTFIARHADIVNLSFVNTPEDVYTLQEELKKLNASHVGIMLKIETQHGFKNLPFLLLAAMKTSPVGVMIARGDLAVECGWKRLAEIQEEILWLCEAAHIPVVWATQVLESLAKTGSPSRAEITDAAMSQRADCVMLNKGPFILNAVEMLSDILERMSKHQHKKTSMLRNLKITEVFNLK